jgi:hypothetical protein
VYVFAFQQIQQNSIFLVVQTLQSYRSLLRNPVLWWPSKSIVRERKRKEAAMAGNLLVLRCLSKGWWARVDTSKSRSLDRGASQESFPEHQYKYTSHHHENKISSQTTSFHSQQHVASSCKVTDCIRYLVGGLTLNSPAQKPTAACPSSSSRTVPRLTFWTFSERTTPPSLCNPLHPRNSASGF